MAELQVGDEIIVEGYRDTLIVARVGEKLVKARMRNFPFLLSIPKEKIIWRSGMPPEQIIRSLKGISGLEPTIMLRKKKYLKKAML